MVQWTGGMPVHRMLAPFLLHRGTPIAVEVLGIHVAIACQPMAVSLGRYFTLNTSLSTED